MKTNSKHGVTWPVGFRAAGGTCGIKKSGLPDLMLLVADSACAAAGVFTTNKMTSAAVDVNRRHLPASRGLARAVVVNSGNANSSTGKPGDRDAVAMCAQVARLVGCPREQVLVGSTGIIGVPLPMEKISKGIAALAGDLDRGPAADAAAAKAILTTDLVAKSACREVKIAGKTVRLAGICKGSGMIAPNMATMLAYVTTDAAISPGTLQRTLSAAAAASFNRISVNQHTSPSDTLIALASGAAGNKPVAGGRDLEIFQAALTEVCADLAYQIVKDGEGATKLFRVRVVNAGSESDADRVGRAIVDSPLVKTAVHGGDPNWGRIVTAAGYSGAVMSAEKMSLNIADFADPRGGILVYRRGQPTKLSPAVAKKLGKIMRQKEIVFTIDLGIGKSRVEWLGCDLSRQYIAINADYTT